MLLHCPSMHCRGYSMLFISLACLLSANPLPCNSVLFRCLSSPFQYGALPFLCYSLFFSSIPSLIISKPPPFPSSLILCSSALFHRYSMLFHSPSMPSLSLPRLSVATPVGANPLRFRSALRSSVTLLLPPTLPAVHELRRTSRHRSFWPSDPAAGSLSR